MVAHHGRSTYQAYPGMRPSDHHVWMSAANSTVGLVYAQLEAEGLIDVQLKVVDYVDELAGTHWDGITVLNALNMALGLQLEETMQSLIDPTNLIVRFFSAEPGEPAPGGTDVEHWLDVVKLAESIDGEAPGTRMRYVSATTTVLNYLVERPLIKTWTDIFTERVWSKLGARGPALLNLTPEGTAVAHGLLSTTLEDFARYAIAFPPAGRRRRTSRSCPTRCCGVCRPAANRRPTSTAPPTRATRHTSARNRRRTASSPTACSPTARCSSTATSDRASTSTPAATSSASTSPPTATSQDRA